MPQGSVLGPLLFLSYIDDFHQSISHSAVLMFADDMAIYKEIESQSDHKLQADLKRVFDWSRKWQLNLNPSKCETKCISYKHSPPPANYRIYNHNLSSKSVVRYGGAICTRKGTSIFIAGNSKLTFNGNRASDGAAIYSEDHSIIMFHGNKVDYVCCNPVSE